MFYPMDGVGSRDHAGDEVSGWAIYVRGFSRGVPALGCRWPSNESLAVATGLTERAVQEARKGLVTKGWLAEAAVQDKPTKVMSIDVELRDKLVSAGVVSPMAGDSAGRALGPFVERCIARQEGQVKERSMVLRRQSQRSLIDYFGENRAIDTITEGEAEDYRAWILTEAEHRRRKKRVKGLSGSVARKQCADARMWFKNAVRLKLIDSNPFDVGRWRRWPRSSTSL